MEKFLKIGVFFTLISIGMSQNPGQCIYLVENGVYTCKVEYGTVSESRANDKVTGTHVEKTDDDVVKFISPSPITVYMVQASTLTFKNLEIIEIPIGDFNYINSSHIVQCEKWKKFLLNKCNSGLTTILSRTFSACKALEEINLSENEIASVQSEAFAELSALTTIDLSKNLLTGLSASLFNGLTELKSVNLNDNKIKSFSDQLFVSTKKLEILTFSRNELEVLYKATVSEINALKSIDASKNKLNKAERGLFDKFTQLESANFIDNVCVNEDFNPVNIDYVKEQFETCFKNNGATELIIYSKIILLFITIISKFL